MCRMARVRWRGSGGPPPSSQPPSGCESVCDPIRRLGADGSPPSPYTVPMPSILLLASPASAILAITHSRAAMSGGVSACRCVFV